MISPCNSCPHFLAHRVVGRNTAQTPLLEKSLKRLLKNLSKAFWRPLKAFQRAFRGFQGLGKNTSGPKMHPPSLGKKKRKNYCFFATTIQQQKNRPDPKCLKIGLITWVRSWNFESLKAWKVGDKEFLKIWSLSNSKFVPLELQSLKAVAEEVCHTSKFETERTLTSRRPGTQMAP